MLLLRGGRGRRRRRSSRRVGWRRGAVPRAEAGAGAAVPPDVRHVLHVRGQPDHHLVLLLLLLVGVVHREDMGQVLEPPEQPRHQRLPLPRRRRRHLAPCLGGTWVTTTNLQYASSKKKRGPRLGHSHAPCGFLPAWTTTSTLDWERQPEEKGRAMSRRCACSLPMATGLATPGAGSQQLSTCWRTPSSSACWSNQQTNQAEQVAS
jgi:hypothetical protein